MRLSKASITAVRYRWAEIVRFSPSTAMHGQSVYTFNTKGRYGKTVRDVFVYVLQSRPTILRDE